MGDETLLSQDGGDWTVSAAALYLLRTLSESHTKDNPVGDQLFPCCGHCMWDIEGNEDVVIVGCPNGADFEVIHDGNEIIIGSAPARIYRIPLSDWRAAVCDFSDAVRSFYAASSPKQPADQDEAKGFRNSWMNGTVGGHWRIPGETPCMACVTGWGAAVLRPYTGPIGMHCPPGGDRMYRDSFRPRRHSIRLRDRDYARASAYFVTIKAEGTGEIETRGEWDGSVE